MWIHDNVQAMHDYMDRYITVYVRGISFTC